MIFLALSVDVGRLVLAPTWEASIDAVRIRNAMVAELGTPAATEWQPSQVPTTFNWETRPAPGYFTTIAARVAPPETRQGTALATAIRLAMHLRQTARPGAPIQANTRDTYQKIIAGKGGYCSDFTQSFNALALAAGLDIREWGFAWETMANGHAFNEVWEPSLQKWVFIDSFVSFYVVDRDSGEPLSTLEFREALLTEGGVTADQVVKIVPSQFGFKSVEKALSWYRRGAPRMFLLLGNNVYSYDAHPLIQFAEALPRSVEMMLAIALGEHPRFLFVPDDQHPKVLAQVQAMRWELIWVAAKIAGIGLLGPTIAFLLWRLFRTRHGRVRPT